MILDLRRLDEVAGPPSYELTGYRRSDISALEAQRRASHGSLCDRSVALARRLAGILYALWRDGTQFDPAH